MEPTTIKELDQWMRINCYRDTYGIGNRSVDEGCGLDTFGTLYVWYYTERGKRENLQYFKTEVAAVQYAFNQIKADKFANAHLIGFLKEKEAAVKLFLELEKRNISYWEDQIPYGGINDSRVRVFVFGCDINKVSDLQATYGKLL